MRNLVRRSLIPPISRLSLRIKVTLAVLLPLLIILGISTIIEYQHHKALMLTNLSVVASQAGQVIETNLRQQMLRTDLVDMQHLLDAIQESQGFRVVYLLNIRGEIIFASQNKDVGKLLNNHQADCLPCHRLPVAQRPSSVVVTTPDGQRVFRSMNPIENAPACNQCHDPSQRIIGLLLTDISTAPVEASLGADLRANLFWWAFTILVTILIVNLVLDRLVLRRLEKFSLAIQDFGLEQQSPHLSDDKPDEIGNLMAAFGSMTQQIETRNIENRTLSENLQRQSEERGKLLKRLITAQENERTRVARELHDELGQALSGLSLQTEIIQRYIKDDPDRANEYIKEIQALIRETTDCMYDLIMALRPSILDDLGLVAALRAHSERSFMGKDIQYILDASQLTDRLPPELETVLYRTFQEAINNIIRHAQATQVTIRLSRINGHFEGEIVDDGHGFDPGSVQYDANPRGLGLMGMRERITQCGGRLEIISKPGKGTRISIFIPMDRVNCG
ncbi:MAG: HAMP domain-containing sensor histidine kinase [Omnitrophica WOR_2 bacterium]